MSARKDHLIARIANRPRLLLPVALIVAALLNAFVFVVYLQPAMAERSAAETNHDSKKLQLDMFAALPDPPRVDGERLARINEQIPVEPKMDVLIGQLDGLARRHEVMIMEIRTALEENNTYNPAAGLLEPEPDPSDPDASEDPSALQVDFLSLRMVGRLEDLLVFVQALDGIEPLVELDSWTVTEQDALSTTYLAFLERMAEEKPSGKTPDPGSLPDLLYEMQANLAVPSAPILADLLPPEDPFEPGGEIERAKNRLSNLYPSLRETVRPKAKEE